jgi:predicted thioesterase
MKKKGMVNKMNDLYVGLKGEVTVIVSEKNIASSIGSGLLDVFATPCMISIMEEAASDSLLPFLQEGYSSVGTKVDITHIRASGLGAKIKSESVLEKIDGNKLEFHVVASDEKGVIGQGSHTRFIVENARLMAKL